MAEKRYLIRVIADTKAVGVVKQKLKEIDGVTKVTSRNMAQGATKTNDFIKALRRVAIVVPVWFAFRQTMMAVFNTLRQGAKHYVEIESQLARAAVVTSGVSGTMESAMNDLRIVAENYGRSHVGTAKDVIEAYYRMATSGMEFTEAIEASIPATKLAMATYGDTAEVAKTVSAIYRLMGDNIEGATTRQEKLARITDVLATAYANNELEINELAQSMANFGARANSLNLSLSQTIALLATSSQGLIKAGRAGRLTSRMFDDLIQHLDEVEDLLGRAIDPNQAQDWFDLFDELAVKFRDLNTMTPKVQKQMAEIFNIRSRREFQLFAELFDKLHENLAQFETGAEGAVERMLALRDATPEVQLENFRENLNMLVRDFITGITDAEDFAAGLREINEALEEMGPRLAVAGSLIKDILKDLRAAWRTVGTPAQVVGAFAGGISGLITEGNLEGFKQVQEVLNQNVEDSKELLGVHKTITNAIKEYEDSINRQKRQHKDSTEKEKQAAREQVEKMKQNVQSVIEVNQETLRKITLQEKSLEYTRLQLKGVSDMAIEYRKLYDYVDTAAESLQDMGVEVDTQQLMTAVLAKDWEKVLLLTKENVITEKELVKLAEMLNNIEAKRLELVKSYGDTLKNSISGSIQDIFKGQASVNDLFKNFGETLAESWGQAFSKRLTNMLADSGIFEDFGEVFAGIEDPMVAAHKEGAKKMEAGMRRAIDYHGQVLREILGESVSAAAPGYAGSTAAIASKLGYAAPGAGIITANTFGASRYPGGYVGMSGVSGGKDPSAGGGFMKGTGTLLSVAGSAYGGFQGGQSAGGMAGGILGGISGLASGLASAGFMGAGTAAATGLGAMLGPIGIIAGIGAMIAGAFKKTTRTEVKEQTETHQVASRIDVTNKQLELVNRNLLAIERKIGYIMPESTYFSEGNIPDNFDRNSQRGMS